MKASITIDVEQDLHSLYPDYKGLEQGIPVLLEILDKYNIKATFFVPALLLEKFPDYFKLLEEQGHEIALHGYTHENFNELSLWERYLRINKSMDIFRRIFNQNPFGFRAPQHSIDKQTLQILKQNNFLYDASYTPLNLLQLLFFPKRFGLWFKGFFKPRKNYKLDKNFYEIPTSSFIIPFVSLPLRIFPWSFLKIYLYLLKKTNKNLIFYAHSWDFIPLPKSKIDRFFSYKKLLKNLENITRYLSKNKQNKFLKMEQIAIQAF